MTARRRPLAAEPAPPLPPAAFGEAPEPAAGAAAASGPIASPPSSVDLAAGGLIEALLDAVWLVDAAPRRSVAANHRAGLLTGVPANDLIGQDVAALAATPEDACFWTEAAAGVAGDIESHTLLLRADGSLAEVTRRATRVVSPDGSAVYVVALRDRSEQAAAERHLETVAADLRATLESTHDGILVTGRGGRIRHFNRRFAALWQIPAVLLADADADNHNDGALREWMCRSVVEPGAYTRRLGVINDTPGFAATDLLRLLGGRVLERTTMPQLLQGQPVGRVFSFRDVTERVEAEQRIQTLATTSALTGLPNRRLLADRVEVALAAARRDATPFALLFLNVDRFKQVNDTLGRVFGDQVLRDVGERIKACVREVDTVAHLGGDEFVVLAHQAGEAGAGIAAERLIAALKQPFTQDGMSFTVTASVGISLFPSDGASLDELVHRSDAAMRQVKAAGRAGFRFHRASGAAADGSSRSRLRLDHAMRLALARGDFRLHYQPQVDFGSARVVSAEALLRWRDPELGEVSPAEVIAVAEASGFIVEIGDWVLTTAVAQAAAWRAAGLALPVAVNVSALQFQQPGFVDGVARALRAAGLPPASLELELTESILVQDPSDTAGATDALLRLQALAQLGVQLSIDDFGTGYSSLAYLKRFPIGRLKIDRGFVSGLPASDGDAAIVRAIVQMGHALRLQVVAEGVETRLQHDFLRAAGCDLFQGHLFAPALDAAGFEMCVADTVPFPVVPTTTTTTT